MKKIYLSIIVFLMPPLFLKAQNAPFLLWGAGLDGSTYQQSAFYSDVTNGLHIEAPLDPSGARLPISFSWRGGGVTPLMILPNGNIGIGTTTPDKLLSVKGTIHSKEVLVDLTGWSDYVFKPTYKLPSLSQVKTYIDQNQRLPDVPSEKELVKNGLKVGEMNKLLMKKVEELTLYLIEQDREKKEQSAKLAELTEQVKALSAKLQNDH